MILLLLHSRYRWSFFYWSLLRWSFFHSALHFRSSLGSVQLPSLDQEGENLLLLLYGEPLDRPEIVRDTLHDGRQRQINVLRLHLLHVRILSTLTESCYQFCTDSLNAYRQLQNSLSSVFSRGGAMVSISLGRVGAEETSSRNLPLL